MSDNSRITIILAVAMALAVSLSVLLFVYLFYRAQATRLHDPEALRKNHHASILHGKPLPRIPHQHRIGVPSSSPQPSGVNPRSPPSILQRRQASQSRNGALPLRDLQLDHANRTHRELPENNNQQDAREQLGDISIGLSPDTGAVPFTPTPRAPRLSRQTISKLRGPRSQPPIEKHPVWESVPEEESPGVQDTATSINRI